MSVAKTYGQFCALARALDHIGDRWTLLVVRELLIATAGYGDLQASLPGVPTNLLADRLRDLERDGLVRRTTDERDRRRSTYRLTPLGRELEPAIRALIVWGRHWMSGGPGDDRFDPRWMTLAITALLAERIPTATGTIEVRFAGGALTVASRAGRNLRVTQGAAETTPDAVIDGEPTLLLALISGEMSRGLAARRGVRLRGPRPLLQALLRT